VLRDANDKSGNGNNGAIHGEWLFVADRFGNPGSSCNLNGVNGYIDIPGTQLIFIAIWAFVSGLICDRSKSMVDHIRNLIWKYPTIRTITGGSDKTFLHKLLFCRSFLRWISFDWFRFAHCFSYFDAWNHICFYEESSIFYIVFEWDRSPSQTPAGTSASSLAMATLH